MLKSVEYRIYPNKEQEILFAKHFGCNRLIYNKMLDLRTSYFLKYQEPLSKYELNNYITFLKKTDEYNFLKEVHSQTLQQTVQDLDTAFINYFRNPDKKDLKGKVKKKLQRGEDVVITLSDHAGYPNYKTKHSNRHSIRFPQGGKIDEENNKVFIPKIKWIKARIHRIIQGEIRSVTIKKVPSGKYFAVFLIEDNMSYLPELPIERNKTIGIDMGLKDFCILSNGTKITNPKFLRNKECRLKILQKRLSRKQKSSKNRNKARIKVAKIHERIYNERKDFLNKLTTQLTNDSQVSTYCLETLNIKGMVKNHNLAKSISEASWYQFKILLESKCKKLGKHVISIGQFEPSSKLCPCGYKNNNLTLRDREWTCPNCGTHHDRDILAANNIKNMALTKVNMTNISRPERSGGLEELLSLDRALNQEAMFFRA